MRARVLDLLSANSLHDVKTMLETEPTRLVEVDISALKHGDRTILISLGTGVEDTLKSNDVRVTARITSGFAVRFSSLRNDAGEGMLEVEPLTQSELEKLNDDIAVNSNNYLELLPGKEAFSLAFLDADRKKTKGLAQLEVLFGAESGGLSGVYRYANGNFLFAGASGSTGNEIRAKIKDEGIYLPLVFNRKFADMSTHWALEEVRFMSARHVVKGVSVSELAPDRAVTRAEVASLLVRALSLNTSNNTNYFKDVQTDAWYADNVSAAAASGLIVGLAEGIFAPDKPLTRAELAVIVSRVLTGRTFSGNLQDNILTGFTDKVEIPDWAVSGIEEVVYLGLLKGRSTTQLAPGETVSRAEAATFLARMLRMLELGE